MSDDTCGHPTAEDTPCQHPTTDDGDPERCWISDHNDTETDSGDPGRPSTLKDHRDEILEGARQGMTLEGCARLAGVAEKTLHSWINKYDDFRKSLKRARAKGELKHLQSVNDRGSQFILERSFGYVKTEKREISGDDGSAVAVELRREVVDSDGD